MSKTADAVIVGGGLIGLCIAWHLAGKGMRDIMVLEKEDTLISHSSGRSAGGIRLQFSTAPNVLMSKHSLERFKHFEAEMGVPSDLRQVGYLFLITDAAGWPAFEQQAAMQQSLGVPTRLLSPADVAELAPFVVTDDLIGATFCPEDGYADPFGVARGYELRARDLGVRILTEAEVTGIHTRAGRVTGVATTVGDFHAPVVVNAAGPWAGELAGLAGVELPVEPYRRQIYVTEDFPALPDDMPFTVDFDTSAYCRKEGARILMGMSDQDEPASFRTHTDDDFLLKLIETLVRRVPVLAEAGIYRGWGGLYEVTPDHNAILGEHPDLGGFFLANGFSGHGFQQAPAVGRIIAELVLGEQPFIDISSLGLERFRQGRASTENAII